MIQDPLTLAALIAGLTALAFWLDYRFTAMSRVTASLLAIIFGALLSNLGVVPAVSPVYDAVTGPITSLAIAWLLLAVDLSDVRKAGPRTIGAFALAAVATAIGAFIAAAIFSDAFGEQNWRLAGTITGTYSGGSVNFVSVGRATGLSDTLFAGATAADSLTTGLWLGATLMLPLWLSRFYPKPPASVIGNAVDGDGAEARRAHHPFFMDTPLSTLRIALLLAVGLGLLLGAELLAGFTPGIPAVLWLTTIALLVGHLTPMRRAPGALQLGNLALHGFFVVIGIFSRIDEILAVGIEVFLFTLVVVGVHGLIVFGVGRFARLDLPTLSVASQAAVGGPSSALAVAVAREWRGLVLPGVLVGLLGYAVGNYLGFAVAGAVRAIGW